MVKHPLLNDKSLPLLAALPDAVLALDNSGQIIYCNASTAGIFGYEISELVGQPLNLILPGQDLPGHDIGDAVTLTGRRRSGQKFTAEAIVGRLKTSSRTQPITVILVRDISGRGAQQLDQLLTKSALAADTLMALNQLPDSIVVLDDQWRFSYINDAAETLLGPREAVLGTVLWEAHPAVRGTKFETIYRQCRADQQPRQLVEYYEPYDSWYEVGVHPSHHTLLLHIRDVSAQYHTEAMNERLLTALEHILDNGPNRRRPGA